MQKDLFQFLSNTFEKREVETPTTCDKGEFYMVVKYLSLYPDTFFVSDDANRLMAKIPPWATGCFLYHSVDKQNPAPFIKYPKKDKKESKEDKKQTELLKKVSAYFCCSLVHAEQIITILEKKHNNVYHLFGMEGKNGRNR